jgi:hypothetical protein
MRVKRTFLISLVVLAFSIAMLAQAGGSYPSSTQNPNPPTSTTSSPDQTQSAASTPDQTATPSSTPSSTKSETAGKSAKLKGCLSQSNGMFMLSDKDHPSGVQLDPGTQDLSAHVGHKIEVKGTWENAPASSASATPSSSTVGGSTSASGSTAGSPSSATAPGTSASAGTTTGGTTGATAGAATGTSGTQTGATGSVSGNAGTTSGQTGAAGATTESGSMGSMSGMSGNGMALKIDSIKHVSDTCGINK